LKVTRHSDGVERSRVKRVYAMSARPFEGELLMLFVLFSLSSVSTVVAFIFIVCIGIESPGIAAVGDRS